MAGAAFKGRKNQPGKKSPPKTHGAMTGNKSPTYHGAMKGSASVKKTGAM